MGYFHFKEMQRQATILDKDAATTCLELLNAPAADRKLQPYWAGIGKGRFVQLARQINRMHHLYLQRLVTLVRDRAYKVCQCNKGKHTFSNDTQPLMVSEYMEMPDEIFFVALAEYTHGPTSIQISSE